MASRDTTYPNWEHACESFRVDALEHCAEERWRQVNLNKSRQPSAEDVRRLLFEAEMLVRYWVEC